MSFSAVIPTTDMTAANATLEAQGYGPGNFSVPVYDGVRPEYATLHAWSDAGFQSAVEAISGVAVSDIAGEPIDRVNAAINATSATASFSGNAQPLEGQVTPGLHQDSDGVLWWVIQPYDTTTWPDPAVVPALVRRARIPGEALDWVQPIDQFDSYLLEDPFTGEAEVAIHQGSRWRTKVNFNVWEPGTDPTLWEEIDADGNVITPPLPDLPARWSQGGGTGTAGSYNLGDLVVHDRPQDSGNDWVFESAISANTTEPSRDSTFDRWWTPISLASEYVP